MIKLLGSIPDWHLRRGCIAFMAISSIAGENGTQTISAENTSATSTFPFSGEFVVDELMWATVTSSRPHVLRDFDENDILLRFVSRLESSWRIAPGR